MYYQVLYEGPVRDLCPLAPNNTNTMACAALAARESGIGLDEAIGCLICDPSFKAHIIDVEVEGPTTEGIGAFKVTSTRFNPAKKGAVTGNATYMSFFSSLIEASRYSKGDGLHFC
jgi:predicted dinucleotide-utilizing enzyme